MNERVCKKPSIIEKKKDLTGVDLVQHKKQREIPAHLCKIEQTLIEAMCFACYMRGHANDACMMYGITTKTNMLPSKEQCNNLYNHKKLDAEVWFKGESYAVKLTDVEPGSTHERALLGKFAQRGCEGHNPKQKRLTPYGQMLKVRYLITYEAIDLSYYPLTNELAYKGRLIDKNPAGITHSELGTIVYDEAELACELDYVKRSFSSITSVTFEDKEEYVYISDETQKSLQVSLGREMNHQCLGEKMIELSIDELHLCRGCNLGIGKLSLDFSTQFYDAFMQLNTIDGIKIRTQQYYLEETRFELCQLINFLSGKNYDLESYLGSNGKVSVKREERLGVTYLTPCNEVWVIPHFGKKECFEHLPVLFEGKEMFLESGTYHLRKNSQTISCNNDTVFQSISRSGKSLYFCNPPELKVCNIANLHSSKKKMASMEVIRVASIFNKSDSELKFNKTLQKVRQHKLRPGQESTFTTAVPSIYNFESHESSYRYPSPYLLESIIASYFNSAKTTANLYINYLSFESRNYCAFVILITIDHVKYILKVRKINVVIIFTYILYLYIPVLYIIPKISRNKREERTQERPQDLIRRGLARVERVAASYGRIRTNPGDSGDEPCHSAGAPGADPASEMELREQSQNSRGRQQSS